MHLLAPPADEAEQRMELAGCKVAAAAPPKPTFWEAVQAGDTERVGVLADADEGLMREKGGPYGCTALGWAALSSDLPLLKLCLARGADPNARAAKGSSPLHMALWNSDFAEGVRLLLGAGAKPMLPHAVSEQTPLELARWFDGLETSAATSPFEMGEWRKQWGKPRAGRAGCIALLEEAEAATSKDQVSEA